MSGRERVTIPKVHSTRRGSAGWFLSDGRICVKGVHLICGGCGKHCGDMRNHTIDDDGTVHKSILCAKCGWHVYGMLEGWTELNIPID